MANQGQSPFYSSRQSLKPSRLPAILRRQAVPSPTNVQSSSSCVCAGQIPDHKTRNCHNKTSMIALKVWAPRHPHLHEDLFDCTTSGILPPRTPKARTFIVIRVRESAWGPCVIGAPSPCIPSPIHVEGSMFSCAHHSTKSLCLWCVGSMTNMDRSASATPAAKTSCAQRKGHGVSSAVVFCVCSK